MLAYRDAAKVIRQSPVSIAELTRAGRVTELPGIGKTIEEKIVSLLETGSIPSADKLKAKFPPSLVEVTLIPGLGAKTVRRLHDELGHRDPRRPARRDRRAEGPRPEGTRPEGRGEHRRPAREARRRGALGAGPPLRRPADRRAAARGPAGASRVEAVDVAGSARRLAETCKDIDLIATASDPVGLAKALVEHPLAAASGNPSANGARVTTYNGVKVDLRIVPPEEYGNLLQHFTGSAAHNVELRERAREDGPVGVRARDQGHRDRARSRSTRPRPPCTSASASPTSSPSCARAAARSGRRPSGKLPKLVELGDIRGDLHSHTTLSDGKNTLEEMAAAAKAKGYAYFAVTDHSASHGFGDHVTPERLEERIDEIAALNAEIGSSRFRILAGTESNILPDGSLDYEDSLLERLDWVVASVHTSFRMTRANMTARMIAAIEHPLVDCLGHPSGRMLLRREGYDFDIEAVAEAAARTGTFIEINGNPNRRDLSEQNARVVADAGVKICLQHRRPPGLDAREHALRDRDGPPRLADQGRDREHPALERSSRSCASPGAPKPACAPTLAGSRRDAGTCRPPKGIEMSTLAVILIIVAALIVIALIAAAVRRRALDRRSEERREMASAHRDEASEPASRRIERPHSPRRRPLAPAGMPRRPNSAPVWRRRSGRRQRPTASTRTPSTPMTSNPRQPQRRS